MSNCWLAATALLLTISTSCHATQFLFSCEFEDASLRVTDPIAKEWVQSTYFRKRSFIITLEPPAVVDPADTDIFWRNPRVIADPKEIRVDWDIWAKPLDRKPRIALFVNRFRGKALEVLSMLEKPNQGPEYSYASRHGICEISVRKL